MPFLVPEHLYMLALYNVHGCFGDMAASYMSIPFRGMYLVRYSKYIRYITCFCKMAACVERALFFLFVTVIVQCFQLQIASAVGCTFVSGSTCKCTLADGSGEIDLSPLFARGALSVQQYVPRGVLTQHDYSILTYLSLGVRSLRHCLL